MRSTDAPQSRESASRSQRANRPNRQERDIMPSTLTIKEIAQKWDTTPRTLRKYMRSAAKAQGGVIGEDTPGKGGRYAIEAKSLRSMRKGFDAWMRANEARRQEKAESTEIPEGDDQVESTESPNQDDALESTE